MRLVHSLERTPRAASPDRAEKGLEEEGMGESRYIVVEGPIGVGKTTLVKVLADVFQAKAVLERADENPFLTKFYEDPGKFAFQTQIFFLLTRYQQQQEILQTELFRQNIVSDYLFAKDRIFAYLNLSEDELVLYEWIYQLLDQRVAKPDLVIYLQAPVQVLLKRIRRRALWYEKEMQQEYVEKVCQAYSTFFFHYRDTPLLVVNSSTIDFVQRDADLKNLIREIQNTDKGVRYITIAPNVDPLP
jgi:deoxyadenosine/deoxycytidine kinase